MFRRRIKKWYIKHTDVRVPENGTAYFGPFNSVEIEARLNDAQADAFADSGNVEAVKLPFWRRWRMYINPREWWFQQLIERESHVL